MRAPYEPPPYPYDRLNELKVHGEKFDGGLVDLSIGTPRDPAPQASLDAMVGTTSERGYPASIGIEPVRDSARAWMLRRFDVAIAPNELAACVGSKELVVALPHLLNLRDPSRDTILYPALAYPSYAMGAELAHLRAVPVAVDDQWRIRLDSIDPADAARALCVWVNTPGNPAGGLDDLAAAAEWGRANDVLVVSDECYIEFTWDDPFGAARPSGVKGRSILEHGTSGVLAVHSLSKRSNFAGGRFGFYAGDARLVHFLSEVRKHQGMLAAGPMQWAAKAAFDDDSHVDEQAALYRERLEFFAAMLQKRGLAVDVPGGGFYLWVAAPNGDAWDLAEQLAVDGGMLCSPGEFYGEAGAGHVRMALVEPVERLAVVADRLGNS